MQKAYWDVAPWPLDYSEHHYQQQCLMYCCLESLNKISTHVNGDGGGRRWMPPRGHHCVRRAGARGGSRHGTIERTAKWTFQYRTQQPGQARQGHMKSPGQLSYPDCSHHTLHWRQTRNIFLMVYVVYVVGHSRGFDLLTILLTRWHLKVFKLCLLVDFLKNNIKLHQV